MALSILALTFTAISSFSCKFVKVTTSGDELAPFFLGIWKVEGLIRPGTTEFEIGNANQCIAWTDTTLHNDGSIRAAKIFAVMAMILGCLLCASLVLDFVLKMKLSSSLFNEDSSGTGKVKYVIMTGSFICAVLSALFFNILGTDLCYRDDLDCRWGAGAYCALTAFFVWVIVALNAIHSGLGHPFTDSPRNRTSRSANPNLREHNNPQPSSRSGNTAPRVKSRVSNMNQKKPTSTNQNNTSPSPAPVSTAKQPLPRSVPENPTTTTGGLSVKERTRAFESQVSSRGNVQRENTAKKHFTSTVEQTVVDNDTMAPTGAPIISISEDEKGNRIKTTIFSYVDENGETVIERTIEELPADDDDGDESKVEITVDDDDGDESKAEL